MVKSKIINNIAAILVVFSMMHAKAEEGTETNTLARDLGYFYGFSFGNMLKDGMSDDVDLDSLMVGLRDSVEGKEPQLDAAQRELIFAEVRRRQALAQAEKQKAEAAQAAMAEMQAQATLEAGLAFLKENAARDGVMVTDSGLQYEIMHDEQGETAGVSNRVSVNYKGTFTDGQIFDQSGDAPVEFGLQQVISGWTEGLQLMSAGDKFKFFLPPDLGYGAGGVGQIPGNSVLVFEIELLEIN